MSSVAAVQEMLLHVRRGVNYVFAGAPPSWREASFRGMRTDGAFLVDAEREGGKTVRVAVTSEAGGEFHLANPWSAGVEVRSGPDEAAQLSGPVLSIPIPAGERVELVPAG
jgi:alpha-L-fucosidase 2